MCKRSHIMRILTIWGKTASFELENGGWSMIFLSGRRLLIVQVWCTTHSPLLLLNLLAVEKDFKWQLDAVWSHVNRSLAHCSPVISYILPPVIVSICSHVTALKDRKELEIIGEISQPCNAAKIFILQKNSFGLDRKVRNPKLMRILVEIKNEILNTV